MKKKDFTVALVIATYNWPEALSLCLFSVLRQAEMPDELIIADDGSGPETRQVISEFSNKLSCPVLHVWQPDEGFQLAKIRNKAVAASICEYILQIDGDLVLDENFVRDQKRAAKRGFLAAGSRVLLKKGKSDHVIKNKEIKINPWQSGVKNRMNGIHLPWLGRIVNIFKNTSNNERIRGCSMAFWRSDFVRVNGYSEEFSSWGREDTELVVRLRNAGVQVQFLKFQAIVFHLWHGEASREQLNDNDDILVNTISNSLSTCTNGINKYL